MGNNKYSYNTSRSKSNIMRNVPYVGKEIKRTEKQGVPLMGEASLIQYSPHLKLVQDYSLLSLIHT